MHIDEQCKCVELCKKNDIYAVIWHQHFGKRLCLMQLSNDAKKRGFTCNTYSAIYESFYDLVKDDEMISQVDMSDAKTWPDILQKMKEALAMAKCCAIV